jgi:hypothetical protein
MHDTAEQPTMTSGAVADLAEAAARAAKWAEEALIHPDEDPAVVLAPGTARRMALDEALAEIETGIKKPSYGWRVRFGLMLGLERVLTERPPRLASGTELRRHQIDALAGMLTELIAANQAPAENGNGNGHLNGNVAEETFDEEDEDEPAAEAHGNQRVHRRGHVCGGQAGESSTDDLCRQGQAVTGEHASRPELNGCHSGGVSRACRFVSSVRRPRGANVHRPSRPGPRSASTG